MRIIINIVKTYSYVPHLLACYFQNAWYEIIFGLLIIEIKRDVQDVVMQICRSYHVIIFSSFHSKLAAYAERNRERILRIHLHQLHQLHLHGLLRTRSEFQTQPQNTPQRYQSQLPRQMV